MKKIVLSIVYLFFTVSIYAQDNKVELCKDFVFQCNYITSIVNKNVSIDKQKDFFSELKEAKFSENENRILSNYLKEDKDLFVKESINLLRKTEILKKEIKTDEEFESILNSNIDIIYPPVATCADIKGYEACMTKPNSVAVKRAMRLSLDMWQDIGSGATVGTALAGPDGAGIGALVGLGFFFWTKEEEITNDVNEWATEQENCWNTYCKGSKGQNAGPGMPGGGSGGGPKWYPPMNY